MNGILNESRSKTYMFVPFLTLLLTLSSVLRLTVVDLTILYICRRPSVRLCVRNRFFSKTGHRIFLIIGVKLKDNNGKKMTKPDFPDKDLDHSINIQK